jgi:sec-independent protein translocase protein TatC
MTTTPDHDDVATDASEDRSRMSFLEHLDELRRRIIYSLYATGVGCAISLYFADSLYQYLTRYLSTLIKNPLIAVEISEAFMFQMKVWLYGGMLIASPFIFAQVWLFVAPGLYAREKRVVVPFAASATILFSCGVWFNHRMAFPAMMNFFSTFNSEYLKVMPQISNAWSFYFTMALGMGAVFEMPMLVFFLARFGIVTWKFLAQKWRWAILIIFIIAAVITPSPDYVTQCVFAAPMLGLYVMSIGVAWLFGKQKKEPARI